MTEGADAEFTLTRSNTYTTGTLAVTFTVTDSGEVVRGAAPTRAIFPPNDSKVTVGVGTDDDEVDERDAVLTLELDDGDAYDLGAASTATVTVRDNDDDRPIEGPISLTLNPLAKLVRYGVGETVELVLSAATGGTGPYRYKLEPLPSGLSFEAETRVLSGTPDTPGLTESTYEVRDSAGSPVTGTLYIRIKQSMSMTLNPLAKQSYRVGERVELVLPGATGGTGPYSYSLGPVLPAGLSFDAGTRVLSGTPTTPGLTRLTYGATDSSEPRVTATCSFKIRIKPSILPVVTVAAEAVTVTEGGDAVFVLTRTGAVTGELAVTFGVTGGDEVLRDRAPTGVVFRANAPTARVRLGTVDDSVDEFNARLRLRLEDGDAYNLGAAGEATVTVQDNDGVPELTASDAWAEESTDLVFELSLSPASLERVTVQYAITPGTAQAEDYRGRTADTVTFEPEDIRKEVRLELVDDDLDEVDETVTLRLFGLQSLGAAKLGRDDEATGTIEDDDVSPKGTITMILNPPAKIIRYGVGEPVELMLPAATGGTGPYIYTLGPVLPKGLSFDAGTRVLSGTPTTPGLTELTYGATDASDPPVTVTRTFNVRIRRTRTNSLTLNHVAKQRYGVGERVELVLPAATGGTGPYSYTLGPVLPKGLSFDAGTRVLSGTPTTPGLTRLTYEVTDSAASPATVTHTFNLRISRSIQPARSSAKGVDTVVAVVAEKGAVTEGEEAVFVLLRTGDATAPLAVAVDVDEVGRVLAGAVPREAVFGAKERQVRLRVGTVDDAVDEADGRVRVRVMAGGGYTVDAAAGWAGVEVWDNDEPGESVALWSTTMRVRELGKGVGARGSDLAERGWWEEGEVYELEQLQWFGWPRERVKVRFSRRPAMAEELTLRAGELTLALGEGGSGRTLVWSMEGVPWVVGDEVELRLTRTAAVVEAAAGLSVADARVNESAGRPLGFRVTLSEAQASAVTVRYATSDGSAEAGADYVAASGVVRFEAGERVKTVNVRVLEDAHDEGEETMSLTLSSPFGAEVTEGVATGTIVNTDAMPRAWLGRFGRTVAGQVVEAVEGRMTAARQAGVEVTVAGRRVGVVDEAGFGDAGATGERWQDRLGDWLAGETESEERTVSGREVLAGTSFALTKGTAKSGFVSLWGRGVVTGFDGRDGDLSVEGEVTTGLLGADWRWADWGAGVLLGHSRGEGSHEGQGAGTVSSSLTGIYPWGRHELNERVTVWGVAGYGEGKLRLEPEGQARIESDMELRMAAVGLRGVLMEAPAGGGVELAVKTDALVVRTASEAVQGGSGGRLEAVSAEVTRVRLGLEGTRGFRTEGGGTLTPSLGLGVRHDGGDAETGFGVELGVGVGYASGSSGVTAELRGRGLLTHGASGFREAGLSGSLAFDPTPATDRGLSLSVSQTLGASATGGVEALYGHDTLAGLVEEDEAGPVGLLGRRRLEARMGYGLSAFGGGFTGTPELGFVQSESGRDYSLGWRLRPEGRNAGSFEFRVEGTRREAANEDTPDHGVGVWVTMRW